jgi:hypothetical protein
MSKNITTGVNIIIYLKKIINHVLEMSKDDKITFYIIKHDANNVNIIIYLKKKH